MWWVGLDRYLLEKARVVFQGPLEQTYHIFYCVRAAARLQDERTKDLQLEGTGTFKYLQEIQTPDATPLAAHAHYQRFQDILKTMQETGFEGADIDGILTTISFILHLGNVEFARGNDHDGTVIRNLDKVGPHILRACLLLSRQSRKC